MKDSRPTVALESLAYLGLLALGAWLRLSQLDRDPLSDSEAGEALAALPRPSEVQPADPGRGSPAYVVLTGLAFALSDSQDGIARWLPAAAGTALLCAPLFVRRELGRGPALMTTGLLAISPTLWASARTAGGTSLATLGILFVVLFLARGRAELRGNLEWAAGMLGLAAVSGRSGLVGLSTLAVGAAALLYLNRRRGNPHPESVVVLPWSLSLPPERTRRLLVLAALAGLALASGLGLFVRAIGGVADGLGSWISGWFGGGVSSFPVLLQLPVYEPLLLVCGGIGLMGALRRGSTFERWSAAWAAGALAWLLVYPGRQPDDLVWLVVPLAFLGAGEATRWLERGIEARPAWLVGGFGGAVLALLAFSYVQLAAFAHGLTAAQALFGIPVHLLLALMGIGLAVGTVGLLAAGWSGQIAGAVSSLAGLAVLVVLTLSAGGRLNLAQATARELWWPQATTPELRQMIHTLDTLSSAQHGRVRALPVELADPATPALAWALRGYPAGEPTGPEGRPPVLLMREGSAAARSPSGYLGQSVVIGERWGWTGWWPPDLLRWWIDREAPTLPERWVLFVRPDIAGIGTEAATGEP